MRPLAHWATIQGTQKIRKENRQVHTQQKIRALLQQSMQRDTEQSIICEEN